MWFRGRSRAPRVPRVPIARPLRSIAAVAAIVPPRRPSIAVLPLRPPIARRACLAGSPSGLAQLVTVGRRERLRIAPSPPILAFADLVLEAVPLRLLGVFVLLARIAMLAARTPGLVPGRATVLPASRPGTRPVIVAVRAWPFPAPLALAKAGVTRLIARVEELSPLEPLHDG
jgi:hypothetical protein